MNPELEFIVVFGLADFFERTSSSGSSLSDTEDDDAEDEDEEDDGDE